MILFSGKCLKTSVSLFNRILKNINNNVYSLNTFKIRCNYHKLLLTHMYLDTDLIYINTGTNY